MCEHSLVGVANLNKYGSSFYVYPTMNIGFVVNWDNNRVMNFTTVVGKTMRARGHLQWINQVIMENRVFQPCAHTLQSTIVS